MINDDETNRFELGFKHHKMILTRDRFIKYGLCADIYSKLRYDFQKPGRDTLRDPGFTGFGRFFFVFFLLLMSIAAVKNQVMDRNGNKEADDGIKCRSIPILKGCCARRKAVMK